MMRRQDWIETEGTVKAVYVEQQVEGQSYSVVFTYIVAGHYYSGTYTAGLNVPTVDDVIAVRYDPDNPSKNNLVMREAIISWIVGIIVFAGFGYMLFRWFIK